MSTISIPYKIYQQMKNDAEKARERANKAVADADLKEAALKGVTAQEPKRKPKTTPAAITGAETQPVAELARQAEAAPGTPWTSDTFKPSGGDEFRA